MASKWSASAIKKEALKYSTRTKFSIGSRGAYKAALKINILDQVCGHMRPVKNKPLSYRDIKKEALRYSRRVDFQKNSPSAYFAARRKKILDDVCGHMNTEWCKKWEYSSLTKEALKYKTRSEFHKKASGAYEAAVRLGILEAVCLHMRLKYKTWTKSKVQKEALKYTTRSQFQINSNKAYDAAHSHGWLDDVCGHMKPIVNESQAEQDLLSMIKEYYPKTQKLRDRKASIEEKPYIKGFDIDIYIPELRKGIEFDGDYWHSLQGLKKSRQHWPKKDIENYHKIKDSYFLEKGIEILHIQEKQWNEDPQNVLNKCLEFLRKKRHV